MCDRQGGCWTGLSTEDPLQKKKPSYIQENDWIFIKRIVNTYTEGVITALYSLAMCFKELFFHFHPNGSAISKNYSDFHLKYSPSEWL